jgi:hypothetical protein
LHRGDDQPCPNEVLLSVLQLVFLQLSSYDLQQPVEMLAVLLALLSIYTSQVELHHPEEMVIMNG